MGKSGPQRGERGKDRRLQRELAAKNLQQTIAARLLDLGVELVRTTKSNPVIGLGLGIVLVDTLFRARVLSYTAAAAFYGFTGASVAGNIVGSLAGILPFSEGSGKAGDALQPTANTLYEGSEKAIPAVTPIKSPKTGYSPE